MTKENGWENQLCPTRHQVNNEEGYRIIDYDDKDRILVYLFINTDHQWQAIIVSIYYK